MSHTEKLIDLQKTSMVSENTSSAASAQIEKLEAELAQERKNFSDLQTQSKTTLKFLAKERKDGAKLGQEVSRLQAEAAAMTEAHEEAKLMWSTTTVASNRSAPTPRAAPLRHYTYA